MPIDNQITWKRFPGNKLLIFGSGTYLDEMKLVNGIFTVDRSTADVLEETANFSKVGPADGSRQLYTAVAKHNLVGFDPDRGVARLTITITNRRPGSRASNELESADFQNVAEMSLASLGEEDEKPRPPSE